MKNSGTEKQRGRIRRELSISMSWSGVFGYLLFFIFMFTAVAADVGDSIPAQGVTQAWRPSVRWRGFNLLGMFCQTKMENGQAHFRLFPGRPLPVDGGMGV